MSSEIREFYLLESALGHLQTHSVDFNPPEENVVDGGVILTDPVNVLHTYIDRIRALIDIQIQKWEVRGVLKHRKSKSLFTKGDIWGNFLFSFFNWQPDFLPWSK